jgi:AGCS family alanine or glycine:cation symporter
MTKILDFANSIIWGVPALILILGVGLYLSFRTGFVQITLFPRAVRTFFSRLFRREGDGTSPFRALCTALAATVGTGNIAGVAGAIALGGPGAIFWMWVSGMLGMMIKFAEAALAVRYRQNIGGEYVAGPMYMIKHGLPKRLHWLAGFYCFFGVVAAFGVGNLTQINAVITGANEMLHYFGVHTSFSTNLLLGILLAAAIGAMLLGGARRIGAVAEGLVPFASVLYLIMGAAVLILRWDAIPSALGGIVQGAFSPRAVTGGILGSCFQTMRIGISRGVFTNEAGMGTASIAHGAAEVAHPCEQGLMGVIEVFLDTIVICTMTALVILCSGIPIPYGMDEGAALTGRAFASVYGGWIAAPIALLLCCFAFATVLGWGLYGARCAQYLFGFNAWKTFAWLQSGTVVLGAVMNTGAVWLLAEAVNGLMALPNLIAVAGLSGELVRLTHEYKTRPGSCAASGGTYENFNQCKPLRTVAYAKIPSSCRQRAEAGQEDLPSEHRSA